ncbi:hypothetical protein BRYFOR_06203 [Marvinbryantia formatexigens DSM 14469]|uniref:ABC-2 type transporter n=1 Tax=Marvinbryantia formatexigens DSM 14469 TaxID=478749 RepID=C6LC56_9FIRM|nr:ABC transporter permease subunit [Marvinbryantia formatexigens]EET62009.1 hypothetical protein BRYFOR_06203 [Marvinbryantia formatexigens DSM 14469]UWO25666.1 ABC transporter permease subunit [Marvinbryantia formatexigens DSM 14469]SDF32524.1 hypothetical protein SAMN05660368_00476 [Marvinbryantia formatexigens]
MRQLIRFELKKMFSRKVILAALAVLVFFNINSFLVEFPAEKTAYEQEIAGKYEGLLDDEKVQQMLQDFMPTQEQLEMWKGVHVMHIGLNSIQTAVHAYFANEDGTWNGKTVRDVFGDREIRVGYCSGWLDFSMLLAKMMMGAAILCVLMISPVFSGEYAGMDQLLLTARLGKTKCVAAKVLASFLAALAVAAIFLAGNFAGAFLTLGTQGLEAGTLFCGYEYQRWMPFNISCRTMLCYQTVLSVSGILMLTGITLAVSAAAKNQTTALIAASFLFLLPLILNLPENAPLFKIIGLLPAYQLQFSALMQIGRTGKCFYALLGIPAAAAAMLCGSLLARKLWRGRQTG